MPERIRGEKGVPMYWDEVKQPHYMRFTPTCWENWEAIANQVNLTRPELMEHITRLQPEKLAILLGWLQELSRDTDTPR